MFSLQGRPGSATRVWAVLTAPIVVLGATFAIGVSVIGIAILLEWCYEKLGTMMVRMSDAMADWE